MRVAIVLAGLLLCASAQAQTYSPPWQASIAGTGTPGLSNAPLMFWTQPVTAQAAQQPAIWAFRDASAVPAGNPGQTYKALWALGVSGYTSPGYEWTLTGELHNQTRASTGAQNVAVNGTAWRDKTDDGSPTSSSWGLNGNCVDNTGESPPTAACIGAELDVGGAVGPDPNRQRVIAHAAGSGQPGSHIGYGYVVSPTPGVTIDRAFSTANVGASFGIGLDLAGASFSGAAILMAPEQWLGLDGNANGGFGHFLGFHAGQVIIMTPFGPVFRLADDGAVYLGRVVEQIPHVPASSSSPCETGEHAWDQNYEYRCVAPNSWRRAALSAW
jgi:hypothetical protein